MAVTRSAITNGSDVRKYAQSPEAASRNISKAERADVALSSFASRGNIITVAPSPDFHAASLDGLLAHAAVLGHGLGG